MLGWRNTSAGVNITAMSGWIAIDARKRKSNASKAISAGQCSASQTKGQNVLVRPVAGGRSAALERAWALFIDEQGASRGHSCRDSVAGQRSGGIEASARPETYVRPVRRESL